MQDVGVFQQANNEIENKIELSQGQIQLITPKITLQTSFTYISALDRRQLNILIQS